MIVSRLWQAESGSGNPTDLPVGVAWHAHCSASSARPGRRGDRRWQIQEAAMPASLIRSRATITHAIDRHRWNQIEKGAVVQEDGIITLVGTYAELSRKYPNLPVIGTATRSSCRASSTATITSV
jgi:hypothetical protein